MNSLIVGIVIAAVLIEELVTFLTRENNAAGSKNVLATRQPHGTTTPAIQG